MLRHILIVDDDQEMLLSLKEGLGKYQETFSVSLSEDGEDAVRKMKQKAISLVVTDLKMPRMDGFALLTHIMEHYLDIPVIMITAYSTPKMEQMAKEGGAVGYIEKPFMVEDLARKIITTLRNESDGGTLHSVSSGMFLQVIEMEQKTCTIRVANKPADKHGVLFFRDGNLLDARANGTHGVAAAHEILSWDDVTLSIQNECLQKTNKINGDLQAILLEAMRLKDEAHRREEARREEEARKREEARKTEEVMIRREKERKAESTTGKQESGNSDISAIRKKLENEIGGRSGLENIYKNKSWDGFVSQAAGIGAFFHAGKLRICHIDKGESKDLILLPGEETTVISLRPNSPVDRVIQVLI